MRLHFPDYQRIFAILNPKRVFESTCIFLLNPAERPVTSEQKNHYGQCCTTFGGIFLILVSVWGFGGYDYYHGPDELWTQSVIILGIGLRNELNLFMILSRIMKRQIVRLSSNLNQFSMILFRIKNALCQFKSNNNYSNLDKQLLNEEFDADDEFKNGHESDSAFNNC